MHKARRVAVIVAVVVVTGAALWWFLSPRPTGEPVVPAPPAPGPGPSAGLPSAPVPPAVAVLPGVKPPAPPVPPAPVALKVPPAAAPREAPRLVITGEVARVRTDAVLADVNGKAITLKDLVPVSPSDPATERAMGAGMYAFLLNRAVEREVAFQVAEASGVELGEEQLRQLEVIRQRALEKDPASFTDVHDDLATKAEFDVRDFAGLMTQEALLAAAGGPSKHVTPEMVQAYYEGHQGDFDPLPADPEAKDGAWQKIEIEIRGRLADSVAAEHQKALESLIADLAAQSRISRFVGPANDK